MATRKLYAEILILQIPDEVVGHLTPAYLPGTLMVVPDNP
jgi:hypothetical protein